jgi:hypothetical protein
MQPLQLALGVRWPQSPLPVPDEEMQRAIAIAVASTLLAAGGCKTEKASVANQTPDGLQTAVDIAGFPCRTISRWRVTDSAIGPIRIGAPAASVLHLCPGTIDSTVRNQDMETETSARMLFVPVGSRDTIRVTIEPSDQRVDAIAVRSAQLMTGDSLRVGASITQWRRIHGAQVLYGDHSDDGVLVLPNHCGLIFAISGGGAVPDERVAAESAFATWPDTVHITEIIVSRCAPAGG